MDLNKGFPSPHKSYNFSKKPSYEKDLKLHKRPNGLRRILENTEKGNVAPVLN
jgi:hypothetical protein